ncbi:MAG: septum formation initiator family protein [Peptococcaceae bacterium]|nr:septum formation initiator family protein [Peptococcaceae bacterium]
MAKKKSNPFTSKLHHQNSKEQPSILQEEEKKWSWTQILVCGILLYAGMIFMNGCFSIIDLKAQENAIVAQTQEAKAQQSDLENEVSYMQTQEAVEKTAREDLKMVKPGEILLTQRENDDAETTNNDTQEKNQETTQETTDDENAGA